MAQQKYGFVRENAKTNRYIHNYFDGNGWRGCHLIKKWFSDLRKNNSMKKFRLKNGYSNDLKWPKNVTKKINMAKKFYKKAKFIGKNLKKGLITIFINNFFNYFFSKN